MPVLKIDSTYQLTAAEFIFDWTPSTLTRKLASIKAMKR